MALKEYPYYLANEPRKPNTDLVVTDKFSGEPAYKVARADAAAIDEAIGAAVEAREAMAALKAYQRQDVLYHCVRRFEERADELALSLCIEAGKPIADSRGEVTRLIDTFQIAAEESVRIHGQVLPLDITPRAANYTGMWKRVPIGPCSFISPFNFPLNLAAHKVAPALAVGNPFVLKPASMTPVGALIIGEVLAETDLPQGAFSILPCSRDGAGQFTTDERLKLLSFTGSPEVGWDLKAKAGKKKVVLELGGNAGVIIDEDADIEDAVSRVVIGAFYQSGQSCISVQRIFVHVSLYDRFKDRLIEETGKLKMGDPKEEGNFIGPMIAESEAERLEQWITSATHAGARLLCGGARNGSMVSPAILEGVPDDEPLSCREAFGPVAILEPFTDFDAALDRVNDSRYGLQAGIFTRDLYKANHAWDKLEVGGVVIGDIPSWRVDHMPYGGVKDSGLGREGIRYSMEEMTEMRLMVVRTP
ncbi:MAG: aldehyde dehydrogenase family protein [Acidobacteria bacterium]|uniref:Aldehyde dehydrogenase family protein n=1 Tax=Candidatus Polarisedimenticola svalbardensis TaxID=2886004 RepID=A0A8J6Y7C9_9BACT|nr:aldehyde dehydrogenase family protein [Candidatus Polarisedimenticola svalbardensis]